MNDYGRHPDILDPRAADTFPKLIRAAAARYAGDVAISLKGQTIPDDSVTFSGLESKSAELAKGLIAIGVGKGTRVGFIYGNGPSFAIVLAAISRIGAIAIPISTLVRSNELVRVLRQSDVAGLLVQRSLLGNDYVDRLCEALPELRDGSSTELRMQRVPYLRWILSTGAALPATIADMSLLATGASSVSENLLAQLESEVHPSDQMIEIYTSGSMALPKGVKHNHGPVLFRAHYMRSMLRLERGKEVRAALPMFWVGGLMMYLLPNWEIGATTVCTEGTSTNHRLAIGSVLAEEDLKAGTRPPPYWGLGMSETLGPYSYGDILRLQGYPLCTPMDHIADRYEVRVVDKEGKRVKEGTPGEIQIRGYAVTSGLHKIERSECFEPDGFYRTGDMALMEGGRILFVGREGDMIKAAGSNVSPAEVEMELQQLEGVHSAYVVGLPDPERGQLVVAALVPRDGARLDVHDIESKLRQRLSGYKVPRAYVLITHEEVPMLVSNKVARRQIETLMADKLGRDP
jgi:acyl-CoA synthetase (AMP-forming)/AMP-acid ligase II